MESVKPQRIDCTCCIVGGGPAGVMLGFLLARCGVDVVVLEKHGDFFRDFRGDTIHPSTLEVMDELGLLDEFLKCPHQELHALNIDFGGVPIPIADFSHLPTSCKFIAFMPQWDFLKFLAEAGKSYSGFDLKMETMVLINRSDYFQCGYIIAKGGFETIKTRGIESFRRDLVGLAPFLQNKISAVANWEDVKLLTVTIDRLECWHREGLLCIGDAAHAMSPAGGVGINLAIQDAVATANLLASRLLSRTVTENDLERVQKRRLLPTRFYQGIPRFIHTRFIPNVLAQYQTGSASLPFAFRLFQRVPFLRRITARLVGMGIRREHVVKEIY